jgi:hypothetical protein
VHIGGHGVFIAGLELFPSAYCRRHAPAAAWSVVTPDTAIVIEGYPGSANSFAREAFQLANPDARIASHLHSVAQLREGSRLGVPLLALLRPPDDAIVSLLARFEGFTFGHELRRYARFYRRLTGVAEDVELATFEEVSHSFGDVITRVNHRFGAAFTPFAHDDEAAVDTVMQRLDCFSHDTFGAGAPLRGARPSSERSARAAALHEDLGQPRWASLLDECRERYWLIHQRWAARNRLATPQAS